MFVPTFFIVVSCGIFLAAIMEAFLLYFAYRDQEFLRAQLDCPLTTKDVAAILRINIATVRRMAKKGLIRSRRVGKQYRFDSGYIRSLNTESSMVPKAMPILSPFVGGVPQYDKASLQAYREAAKPEPGSTAEASDQALPGSRS